MKENNDKAAKLSILSSIKIFADATRWKEWYDSKLSLVLTGVFYSLALGINTYPIQWVDIFILSIFTSLYLAFGYAVNNYSDRVPDVLSGKKNVMAAISKRWAILILMILFTAGFGIIVTYLPRPGVLASVGIAYLLAFLYSLPPIRLKEKGWWGVFSSAAAQRTLPLLVCMAVLGDWSIQTGLLCALYILIGVRWMLIHQLSDIKKDDQAGVKGLTVQYGAVYNCRLQQRVFVPLEIALSVLWAVFIFPTWPFIFILFFLYAAWVTCLLLLSQKPKKLFTWDSYSYPLLSDFYEVFFPLSAAAFLAVQQPAGWLSILLLCALQWQRLANCYLRLKKIYTKRYSSKAYETSR